MLCESRGSDPKGEMRKRPWRVGSGEEQIEMVDAPKEDEDEEEDGSRFGDKEDESVCVCV